MNSFRYVLAACWIPGITLVAVLEERELRERFGKEYEDYCSRVPMFIPRLGPTPSKEANHDAGE